MKFGLASDLHLDFSSINPEFYDWRGDVLLLAGDIGEEDFLRKHGYEFFDGASQMADHVLYIAGNHEFYKSELNTTENHLTDFLKQWPNIHLLRNRSFDVGSASIFGATMWTNYHNNPMAELRAMRELNDFRYIRKVPGYSKISTRDILREFQTSFNALMDFLEKDSDGFKIVMTHHAPSMQSVPARYRSDFELNQAYCNAFEGLIESFPSINVWAHGHTHDLFKYTIGKTMILCNPRGYPNERPSHLSPYQPLTFFL